MSFGGTVAKPGTAPMIWEADGTTLGVDAPSSNGEVTTGATGLWLPDGGNPGSATPRQSPSTVCVPQDHHPGKPQFRQLNLGIL